MKLVLEKEWNEKPVGLELEVLEPGAAIGPGTVDPVRAQALVDQGLARILEEGSAAAPEFGESGGTTNEEESVAGAVEEMDGEVGEGVQEGGFEDAADTPATQDSAESEAVQTSAPEESGDDSPRRGRGRGRR